MLKADERLAPEVGHPHKRRKMQRFNAKIEADAEGVISTSHALTLSTLVEVNMAKTSLPKFSKKPIPAGTRFHFLVVLGIDPIRSNGGKRLYLCQCICGKIISVQTNNLKSGHTRSCRCKQGELTYQKKFNYAWRDSAHDSPDWVLYNTYINIRSRCNTPTNPHFKNYGGRGIECRFQSFEHFKETLGYRPSPKHSIDRIDVNGHYEPGNVRWATPQDQNRNRRNNVWITIDGQRKILMEWVEISPLNRSTIRCRRRKGWCDPCAFFLPPKSSTCIHKTDFEAIEELAAGRPLEAEEMRGELYG